MALYTLELPSAHSFSKNRIPIHVESDAGFGKQINVTISVEYDYYGSGNWKIIAKQLLYTDRTGRIFLDLSDLVDAAFEKFIMPDLSTPGITQCYDRVWQVGYQIVEDGGDTIIDSFSMYAGGIPREYELSVNAVPWFIDNHKWFTHKPLSTVVSKRTPEYLTLKTPLSGAVDVDVKFVVTEVGGLTFTKTVNVTHSGVNAIDFFVIAVGFDANDLQTLIGATVPAFYTVTAYEHATTNIVAETRRYTIDHLYRPFERFFLFVNSLGGVDTLRTIGEAIPKSTYTDVDTEISRQISGIDADVIRLESVESHTKQINTGYRSKEEVDWLRDFRGSLQTYEVESDNLQVLQRIMLTKSELLPSKDNQDVHATVFEYKRTTDNQTYSPYAIHD